ncbi:hypothetical protein [Pseudomonas syringae group sp. J254-4]|nr:hypothetical protein [Pseudomonas syringae group sp. J254-4]MDU8455023.1 hypothetical protein [Pseudomonas syringae group sp. J254-4]
MNYRDTRHCAAQPDRVATNGRTGMDASIESLAQSIARKARSR